MNVVKLCAEVVAVTEILKKLLLKVGVELKGKLAVGLAVVVSIGVVAVGAISTDTPLGLGLIPVLIQVILYSTVGYAVVTKSGSVK
jgi:hypothetical protein